MANTIDKIRQILTLYRDGHFVFIGYRYGDKTLLRKKVAKVSLKEMQQFFNEMADCKK